MINSLVQMFYEEGEWQSRWRGSTVTGKGVCGGRGYRCGAEAVPEPAGPGTVNT